MASEDCGKLSRHMELEGQRNVEKSSMKVLKFPFVFLSKNGFGMTRGSVYDNFHFWLNYAFKETGIVRLTGQR